MKTKATVVGVVQFGKHILLLKRTQERESSPGLWQPVSGFIGEGEAAEDACLREVEEETGLKGEIVEAGEVFEVSDDWGRWIILCFLVKVHSNEVKLDQKEHSEYKWILPDSISKFQCVKGIRSDLESIGLL